MAIKLQADNLQSDDTPIASVSSTALTMASNKSFVAQAITASAGLAVTGSSEFGDEVLIRGNLTVMGTQTLGDAEADSLAVAGDAVFSNGLTASVGMVSSGVLDITDTTDASNASGDSGALRCEGGASIAKKLYVGTDLDVDGVSYLDEVDIDAGAIDGTVIGANSAAAGSFTSLDASGDMTAATITCTGFSVDADGDTALKSLAVDNSSTIGCDADTDLLTLAAQSVTMAADAALTYKGTAVTATGAELNYLDIASLGTAAASKALVADGSAELDAGAITFTDLGTVTTVDINGGTADGVTIGGASPAAANVTSLTASSLAVMDGMAYGFGFDPAGAGGDGLMQIGANSKSVTSSVYATWRPGADNTFDLGASGAEWRNLYLDGVAYLDEVDIDAGAIDGTVIGANSAAAGSFTTANATGLASLDGGINVDDKFTVSAAGAVVAVGVNAGGAISGATTIDGSGDLTMGTITMTGFSVDADGDTALKSLAVDDSSTIGCDSDTDLLTFAAQSVTMAADAALTYKGTAVTATGAELNYLDIASLGTAAASKALVADGSAEIDAGAITFTDLGTVTTADINGGTIDGATLGGAAQVTITNADMNGGSIDGVVIGAASAAAGTFNAVACTAMSASTSVSSPRYNTHAGGTLSVGDDESLDTDYLTFNASEATFANNVNVKALSFVTYSDATLKKDIKPLDNALDKVMSMRGVTYEFKNGQSNDGAAHREVGFLAQEMKQTVPEVVYGNGDGNLGIDYAKLTSVLVEAVKSQQDQIEELRAALLKK